MAINTFLHYNDPDLKKKLGDDVADERDDLLDELRQETNHHWIPIGILLESYGIKITPELEELIMPNFDNYEGEDIIDVCEAYEDALDFTNDLIKNLEKNIQTIKKVIDLKKYRERKRR